MRNRLGTPEEPGEPPPLKPIFLLADSQLLFWREESGPFSQRFREYLDSRSPKAAYLGASNGDDEAFYELFVAAMEEIGLRDCRMIPSRPTAEDVEYLRASDLILLAGGDARTGWDAFVASGVRDLVRERYADGALLIGVSAGALQLGKRTWSGEAPTDENLFPTFKLVPIVFSVHEGEEWPNLRKAVMLSGDATQGVGIPAGGGLIYHPDHQLEPIRKAAFELWLKDDEVREFLLVPGVPARVLGPPEIIDTRGIN